MNGNRTRYKKTLEKMNNKVTNLLEQIRQRDASRQRPALEAKVAELNAKLLDADKEAKRLGRELEEAVEANKTLLADKELLEKEKEALAKELEAAAPPS